MKRRRRIVFFTFGKGSGDLVVGISLALAFKRAGCDVEFTAVTNNEFASIADGFCEHLAVPIEPHLFMVADRKTRLYRTLRRLKPDLLIVYGSWVPVLPFLGEISGRKILLLRQVNKPFLRIEVPGRDPIPINAADYNFALSCEPSFLPPGFQPINPIVIRNRDEIMTRDDARRELGVPEGKKLAVIARNGYEGELEELLARRGRRVGSGLQTQASLDTRASDAAQGRDTPVVSAQLRRNTPAARPAAFASGGPEPSAGSPPRRESTPALEGWHGGPIAAGLSETPDSGRETPGPQDSTTLAPDDRQPRDQQTPVAGPGQQTPAASEWHELVTSNKDGGGVFPLADYAAAIDLLVSGGGYSTFYECRYFGIPSELSAFPRNAEDIEWRLQTNADFTFDVNGADEFVGVAMSD